tara:strand:+ start:4306 stop:4497 length:192 start_codon:yes stop_codon:yes gene_type:complete
MLKKLFEIFIVLSWTLCAVLTMAGFAALIHTDYGAFAGLITFISCGLPWPFIGYYAYKSGELF